MEKLAGVGAVDADLVNLAAVLTDVLDVTQDVTTAILTDKIAKVCAQAHVSDGGLVQAPFLDREALEEDEAFAVEQLVTQRVQQAAGGRGQGELLLGDASQRGGRGDEVVGSLADFGNLVVAERVCPALWVVLVLLSMPYCRAGNLLGESRVWGKLVVDRIELAGSLDTVREDLGRRVVVCVGGELRWFKRGLDGGRSHGVVDCCGRDEQCFGRDQDD